MQQCQVAVQQHQQSTSSDRIQPRHYGEALTEDGTLQRLKEQEEEKRAQANQLAERKTERACQRAQKKEEQKHQQK